MVILNNQFIKSLNKFMRYNNYLYKVHYNYYDDGPKWREKKFLTWKDLQQFIGNKVLMCRYMVVFIKMRGKYREYRMLGVDKL